MQLVEIARVLERCGVDAWGAEILVFLCEACDSALMDFVYHGEAQAPGGPTVSG